MAVGIRRIILSKEASADDRAPGAQVHRLRITGEDDPFLLHDAPGSTTPSSQE